MMKTRLLLLFVGLLSLMSLTSCSDNDDDNPFVGKWQFVSIEDIESLQMGSPKYADYLIENFKNSPLTFRSNGRLTYGDSKASYCYNDQHVYFLYSAFYDTRETYEYSFSDDNNTLYLKMMKMENNRDDFISVSDHSYLLLGKTQVYTRVKWKLEETYPKLEQKVTSISVLNTFGWDEPHGRNDQLL